MDLRTSWEGGREDPRPTSWAWVKRLEEEGNIIGGERRKAFSISIDGRVPCSPPADSWEEARGCEKRRGNDAREKVLGKVA